MGTRAREGVRRRPRQQRVQKRRCGGIGMEEDGGSHLEDPQRVAHTCRPLAPAPGDCRLGIGFRQKRANLRACAGGTSTDAGCGLQDADCRMQ